MQLRPHHLLCMQKFTGHGYSPAFTAHMTALLQSLRTHPETAVSLTCGCDDLCAACPHQQSGICTSAETTAGLDAGTLAAAGFSVRESGTWAALAEAARTRILQTDAFHQICACCEWYPLCRQTEADYEK
ncbi:MAG TPA: hypothetical protein DDX71_01250 [Ruminococcus sp.]|nr:hypothetical protein [Ruminococcus sp.]